MLSQIKYGTIIALFAGWSFLCYHFGSESYRLKDATLAAKQEAAQINKTTQEAAVIVQEGKTYESDVNLQPIPAPIVRVCYTSPTEVSKASPAKPGSDGSPSVPAEDYRPVEPHILTVDTAPIAKIGQLADAQVKELQAYVRDVYLK